MFSKSNNFNSSDQKTQHRELQSDLPRYHSCQLLYNSNSSSIDTSTKQNKYSSDFYRQVKQNQTRKVLSQKQVMTRTIKNRV